MIGYKAFDKDLKCRDMQFEVGKTYKTNATKDKMKLCSDTVIHFCRELHRIESESDYMISESRVCEVIASGDIIDDGLKFGTNEITILRELSKEEKEKFCNFNTGSCNTGDRNTGSCNTGDRNTGGWNTGDCNTGSCNTGGWNTGNRNTGDCNTGNRNTGDCNTGNRNTGDCNTGSCNTGGWNTGNSNTGDCNTGNRNTGFCNAGSCNTGGWNTGNSNTGDCNTGNRNTGDCNTGNRNTGGWNTGDCNIGYFNTKTPAITMFNKPVEIDIENVNFPKFLFFQLTEWVSGNEATGEEKEQYKAEIEASEGFLKVLEYKEAFRIAWDKASKEEHKKLLKLPNWDNAIFKEISGIDAEVEIIKENEQ